MNDLAIKNQLNEIKEELFGAKVTVEDALGNKLYFKLINIEMPYANPHEYQETNLRVVYEGEYIQTTAKRTDVRRQVNENIID